MEAGWGHDTAYHASTVCALVGSNQATSFLTNCPACGECCALAWSAHLLCPGAPAASRSIRSHRHLIRAKVRGPGDLISSITLCLSENPALRSLQGTGRDRAAYRCACAPFRVRPRGRLCGQTAGGVPPAPPGLVWSVVAQQRLQERPAENPPARHAAEPAGMAGRLC
jgi:hypothetical protein